jgi:alpha-galactosidase
MTANCEVLQGSDSGWRLANQVVELVCRAGQDGLVPLSMRDLRSGAVWQMVEGSRWPWLTFDSMDSKPPLQASEFHFNSCQWERQSGGVRFAIGYTLGDENGPRLLEMVWLADDLPVFRRWSELTNSGSQPFVLENFLLIDLAVREDLARSPVELFYVDAFAGHRRDNWEPGDMNFAIHAPKLGAGGAFRLEMGAYRAQCSWLAVRRASQAGIFLGLEYGGAADLRAYDIQRVAVGDTWAARAAIGSGLRLAAIPSGKTNVIIQPGETWCSPGAFWGLFEGDWDEAANLTHTFVEAYLTPPWPDERFPFVELNTWGYAFDLTPDQAWRILQTASEIGAEVFDADYGWMERVGDWQAIERNFPPLLALSNRAHDLGLLFGLWMSFANAHPDSRVAREHSDWLAWPDSWGSFGTRALCLANHETYDWVYEQVRSVIREYRVDHFKFDFEVISPCTNPAHSHPPDPAGYHSSQAFRSILRRLREEYPQIIIESCAGGGRLMTYEMVTLADTSITSDGGVLRDALARRSAIYGASYPFPLRYCDNYMEESPSDLACHSSMIGGPWIVMDRAVEWSEDQKACVKRNVALYKRIRRLFRTGRVYHLRPPDGRYGDALQIQVPSGSGVVYLFQPVLAEEDQLHVALRGLDAEQVYRLTSSRKLGESETFAGHLLLSAGITCHLNPGESEIIEIEPVATDQPG